MPAITVLSCFLLLVVQTIAQEPVYQNLYGYEKFNITSDPLIVPGIIDILQKCEEFAEGAQPDTTPTPNSRYDFIVVGAGTAGSAVASRLAESKGVKVLLIEAGGEEATWMDIPLLPTILQNNTDVNWGYKAEPSDKYCRAMANRQCRIPRGRVMGGSSVLNYMIATRGYKGDFDRWAELGNDGWSSDDVLPYFKKSEDMLVEELRSDVKNHGTDGPVALSYSSFQTPAGAAYLQAVKELGFPIVDFNGESTMGFGRMQSTAKNGFRMSSNKAYLHDKNLPNLQVSKRSVVTKLLIDSGSKRAYGVEFRKQNKTYKVYAKKEIILSAGTIGSAQILLLSGIGPKKDLNELGIKVLKDSRVGSNLQDHISYGGVSYTVDQPVTLRIEEIARSGTPYVREYLLNQTGPLTIAGAAEAIGFFDVFDPLNSSAVPNIEQLFIATAVGADSGLGESFGIRPDVMGLLAPLKEQFAWTSWPLLVKPKSRGYLKLRSAKYDDPPIIVPNYLDDPDDVRTLIAGVNMSMSIGSTKAMQRFNSTLYKFEMESCKQYEGNFDEYMECNIRELTLSIYHLCGTCKMGPEKDETSVVNSELKVIGIKGLRVADASIMPEITSAHITLPVYMIAEKAADLIKKQWNL